MSLPPRKRPEKKGAEKQGEKRNGRGKTKAPASSKKGGGVAVSPADAPVARLSEGRNKKMTWPRPRRGPPPKPGSKSSKEQRHERRILKTAQQDSSDRGSQHSKAVARKKKRTKPCVENPHALPSRIVVGLQREATHSIESWFSGLGLDKDAKFRRCEVFKHVMARTFHGQELLVGERLQRTMIDPGKTRRSAFR